MSTVFPNSPQWLRLIGHQLGETLVSLATMRLPLQRLCSAVVVAAAVVEVASMSSTYGSMRSTAKEGPVTHRHLCDFG
jgi:hypothetical protein